MQPDPKVFLWRAHSELRDIVASGAVQTPAASIALERIAEMLAQLSLRGSDLGPLLNDIGPRQEALLVDILTVLDNVGVPRPAVAAAQIAIDDVRAYDQRAQALADAVSALAHATVDDSDFRVRRNELMRAARDLEAEMRDGWQALVVAKADDTPTLGRDDESRLPPPSAEELQTFLAARVPGAVVVKVGGIRVQRGVNTKDIIFFEVAGLPGWPKAVVMRRLRGFNVNHQVSMSYEFDLLNALNAAGVLTPRALLLESGAGLGQPLIMLEQLGGEAKKAEVLGSKGREIAIQLARHLAGIHNLDPAIAHLPELKLTSRQRMLARIESFYEFWRGNHIEPSSLIESGFAWVRDNVGRLSSQTVLVHGDYDLRNVLIDETRISAVLDWERSHIGHPAEDLAYCRVDAEKLMPWQEFLATYEAAGGNSVTAEEIEYFQTWCQVFRLTSISRAHAGYARGEHADFLLGSAGFVEYVKMSAALHTALQH